MLAAADTFRAAAIEQLGIWAERIGCGIVQGQYNGDPAARLLRRVSARGSREHRVPDLRHRGPPAHEDESHGRTRQGEAHPRQGRPAGAARDPARRRCHHRRQRRCGRRGNFTKPPGSPASIVTKLDGSGKGGVRRRDSERTRHSHALHRHRRKARRPRLLREPRSSSSRCSDAAAAALFRRHKARGAACALAEEETARRVFVLQDDAGNAAASFS